MKSSARVQPASSRHASGFMQFFIVDSDSAHSVRGGMFRKMNGLWSTLTSVVLPFMCCFINNGFSASLDKLTFRSEEVPAAVLYSNGTVDDMANEISIRTEDSGLYIGDSALNECGVAINDTIVVDLVDQQCPLPTGTEIVNIGGEAILPLEYFVIGMHPVFAFPDPSNGALTLLQPVITDASYNVSVAVTSICGAYVLVTVVINVKCNTTRTSAAVTTPSVQVPVHGKSFSPACPPRLVFPEEGVMVITCETAENDPTIRYVPPDSTVGKLAVKDEGNYTFALRTRSNFVVYDNGSVAMGGYLVGDGFKSVLSLRITDALGECKESLLVDLPIIVDCYPERDRTIGVTFDQTSQETSSAEYSGSGDSTTTATTVASPDGVLLSPSERAAPTPSLAQTPVYMVLGIPPGVDI